MLARSSAPVRGRSVRDEAVSEANVERFVEGIEAFNRLGDVTVARVRLRGHGMPSEALTHAMQWHVTEWRNRRVIRIHAFTSEAEALEAAGLSE